MKCNPWRWLWGVPLLLMWCLITFVSEREPVEQDLAARTNIALARAGHGWAQTGFDGRDGIISGRATEQGARQTASQIARDVWGVRALKDETNLLQAVRRYVWSAQLANNEITLSGFVPNEQSRARVLKAVEERFPGTALRDDLKLARGEIKIKPWLSGISFGLEQLSDLESGRLEFINMEYSLAGLAPSYGAYKAVRTALSKKAPSGVRLVKQDVLPPTVSPYTWHAKRSATELVISGFVPNEKARTQLFEYAKKRLPKLAIIDRMETAAGAVPGWSQATAILLEQLAQLQTGIARMSDATLSLIGHAPSEDVAEKVKASADEGMPAAFKITTDLTFPKPKPPTITPFVSSIDVDISHVRLFGYVPNDEERGKLIQAARAKFPSHKIVDDLKLGSGEPQSWRACVLAGLSGIEKLGRGQVRLSGQKISVFGETTDEAVADTLPGDVRALANRACTSNVEVKLNAPPEPQLTWSATNNADGTIVFDGEVPSGEIRASLMSAATKMFPKSEISDLTRVVAGYPKKWRGVAHTGLMLLSKLRKGKASISGQDLVVSGEAKDTAVATAVKGQLKTSIVRGYTGRADLTVRSDAMIWAEQEAKRKAAAVQATARETARRQTEEDARRKVEEEEARRKATAQEQTRREAEREADARRKAQTEAESRRKAEQAEAQTKVEAETLRKTEAQACGQAMRSLVNAGVIRFNFASAELDRKSHPTLNEIAKQAGACPSFKIEVSGHTDSVGAPHRNLALSKRRAQSVVDYLVKAGVPRSRLDAIGYGEAKPVVSNDSKANRAKNRRIEFDVR